MKNIVISQLGTTLDTGHSEKRWNRWRPNIAICQQDDLLIDELHLLHNAQYRRLALLLQKDIAEISPHTKVALHLIEHVNPWDLEEMYTNLYNFCNDFKFAPEENNYLFHITTGTHIAQISVFLLTEANYFPGQLIQTAPRRQSEKASTIGHYSIIDLDLSKYDCIAQRFEKEKSNDIDFLKSGIKTKNKQFNRLMSQIETVAIKSLEPILLLGATGAGKSQLAKRIFELKQQKKQVTGRFVEINCATLRGDTAMSTLFGHKKGSFTGASEARDGLLRTANKGILFLDEIGELGLDEQAMLLRAIEEKRFMPIGSDTEVESDFQLICGTNKNLIEKVNSGQFRDDLLARIDIWSFFLPSLAERIEDIEPNLNYELTRISSETGRKISFNKEAKECFLNFAKHAKWKRNFRDFRAAMTRLTTLAERGRINNNLVEDEVKRLQKAWQNDLNVHKTNLPDHLQNLDLFDQVQLEKVIEVCQQSKSLAEAGRQLFATSRQNKKISNDSDRIKKYLAKFDLTWQEIKKATLS